MKPGVLQGSSPRKVRVSGEHQLRSGMFFLAVNQRRIHFRLSGDGPPLVFLHHATASSRSWRRQAPVFSRYFHVLAYDRPGFGLSEPLASWPKDYHDHDVSDLIALLDALGIDQAALVGHSDGATIALLAAARHPERVACVVAEAPHVFVDVSTCPAGVVGFLEEVRSSEAVQNSLARDHGPRGEQVVQRWADRWLDPDFWDWDVAAEMAGVQCPALILHGAADPFFPIAHSELIASSIRASQLLVLPGVSHVPHREAPAVFNRRVLSFLLESAGAVAGGT